MRARVVFPQPLSPTTAKVSPAATSKLTSFTATKRSALPSPPKTPPPAPKTLAEIAHSQQGTHTEHTPRTVSGNGMAKFGHALIAFGSPVKGNAARRRNLGAFRLVAARSPELE